MSYKTVLVVGASGYFGKKVLAQLKSMQAEKGITIKAMSRKARPAEDGVEWVTGDMMNPASLDKALRGVDVVVTSANGYNKESIKADFIGNQNLIAAATRAGIKRYVLLSITACDKAGKGVPHYWAKYEAEQHLKPSGVPFVSIRAPAFLDQEDDYVADGVKKGKMMMMGDDSKMTCSWVYTWDLAMTMAKACVHPTDDINNQIIDDGWDDGPKTQRQIADCIGKVLNKKISSSVMGWTLLNVMFGCIGIFSAKMADMKAMFGFMRSGQFVSDMTAYRKFFGPSPTMEDAIKRWAKEKGLVAK